MGENYVLSGFTRTCDGFTVMSTQIKVSLWSNLIVLFISCNEMRDFLKLSIKIFAVVRTQVIALRAGHSFSINTDIYRVLQESCKNKNL
jgi:hypothetical protein